MRTLTRILPLGMMLVVLPAASGQQLYRDENGTVYRSRDYLDQSRDDRPWWSGPSGRADDAYRQRSYRPDYGTRYGSNARPAPREGLKLVHQYVLPQNGETVFSIQPEIEDQDALARNYLYQGVKFAVLSRNEPGTVPLYRFYGYDVGHFYGTSRDLGERNGGWYEHTLGYIYPQPQSNTVALHAWFNATSGTYHYSTRSQPNLPPHHEYLGVVGYVIRA